VIEYVNIFSDQGFEKYNENVSSMDGAPRLFDLLSSFDMGLEILGLTMKKINVTLGFNLIILYRNLYKIDDEVLWGYFIVSFN